ncbi:hypothetical protein [Paenibacillus pedocola]|uniref:hypothetical protein n=1 Tax=Paenibacillus pedocola TaxID=3242193 RepID=UPI002877CCF7|nr:hypothetical protein [Paenibacillus typhae]
MSEQPELRLVIEPGVIQVLEMQGLLQAAEAPGTRSGGAAAAIQEQAVKPVLSLEVPQWSAERKEEVLQQLAGHPGELYELLQGRVTGGVAGLQLLPAELDPAGYGSNPEARQPGGLLAWVKKRLAEEPLLMFLLRGMSKEELLGAVFALWMEEETAPQDEGHTAPGSVLAAELARLERKGPAVPTGEWLAEAAAEGSLHQPGPLFHEIASRPFPASPVVAKVTESWETLLPNTPRASEGLTLIMRHVAESAARRAAGLGKL